MTYDSLQDVFIEDIKAYLKNNMNLLLEDYENLNLLKIENAYSYEHRPTPPEIDVVGIDYSEHEESNSYNEGENLSQITLQFYCYGKDMKIKDSEKRYNAIQVVRILADYITRLLSKNIIAKKNKNIISIRKQTQTNPMNVRDMSLYYCVLRYEFVIKNNYKKVYRN